MIITATELKANLGHYLERARYEDVLITHYGKEVARLTAPLADRLELLDELYGSVPNTMTLERAKALRAASQ